MVRVMTSLSKAKVIETITPYVSKYMVPLALVAMPATIYMTLFVTVNRYISVCQKHVILVLVFSLIYNIPRFFEFDIIRSTNSATNQTVTLDTLSALGSNKLYRIV